MRNILVYYIQIISAAAAAFRHLFQRPCARAEQLDRVFLRAIPIITERTFIGRRKIKKITMAIGLTCFLLTAISLRARNSSSSSSSCTHLASSSRDCAKGKERHHFGRCHTIVNPVGIPLGIPLVYALTPGGIRKGFVLV